MGGDLQPLIVAERLRALRCACAEIFENNGCLLVVGGQDGKFNVGSQSLLAYLFGGESGRGLVQGGLTGPLVDDLEDMFMCIDAERVSLFVSGPRHKEIAAVINSLPDSNVFLLRTAEGSDPERAEQYKVGAFLEMCSHMPHTVGVPLTAGWMNKRNKGPAHMEIEQWPIVQTFGLSELNLGGFFTMKHRIVDVTPLLASLWRHVDARCFETTICESIRSIKRHWCEAMRVVSSKPVQKRGNVSEGMVGDPLLSWYEFGRIRMDVDGGARMPCVRFGARTSSRPTSDTDDASLLEAGYHGDTSLHMTLEATDPVTALRVSRTYFCRSDVLPHVSRVKSEGMSLTEGHILFDTTDIENEIEPVSDDECQPELASIEPCEDLVRLRTAYTAAIGCVGTAAAAISDCFVVEAIEKRVVDAVTSAWQHFVTVNSVRLSAASVKLMVECFDAFGGVVRSGSVIQPRCLIFIAVRVVSVPSVHGGTVGDVVYGNTFVLTGVAGDPFNLTQTIPIYRAWATSQEESSVTTSVSRSIAVRSYRAPSGPMPVGSTVHSHISDVRLITPCPDGFADGGVFSGVVDVCEGGFILHSEEFGALPFAVSVCADTLWLVDGSDVWSSIPDRPSRVLHKDVATAVASLALLADEASLLALDECSILFIACSTSAVIHAGSVIALILPENSPVKRAVVNALSGWQSLIAKPSGLTREFTFPDALSGPFGRFLLEEHAFAVTAANCVEDIVLADCQLPWPATEGLGSPRSSSTKSSSRLAIVSGSLLSGHARIADKLASLWGDCLVVSADACSTAADVITALQSRVDSCPHVIVTVSDMIPIVPLCEWIASSEVAQIVNVVACINVLTAFTDARETKPLPVLATQCCRGFVQHILLTNCDTIGEETIVKARGVVSAMNPVASFVRLPGGMATPVIVPAETLTPILENSYDTQPHISLRTVWKSLISPPNKATLLSRHSLPVAVCFVRETFAAFLARVTTPAHDNVSCVLDPSFEVADTEVGARTVACRKSLFAVSVSGAVKFTSDPNTSFKVVAAGGYVVIDDSPSPGLMCLVHNSHSLCVIATMWQAADAAPTISVVGLTEFNVMELQTELLNCRPVLAAALPLLTVDTVSPNDMALLVQNCLRIPLPEDVVFNGNYYMDFAGNTFKDHPELEECVLEFVACVNERRTAFNAQRTDASTARDRELTSGVLSHPPWWACETLLTAEVDSEAVIESVINRRIPLAIARRHSDDDGVESKLQHTSDDDAQ